MISIFRDQLDATLAGKLDQLTMVLQDDGADTATARGRWNSARTERAGVKGHLARMALGIERCMYCGDNLGTDIDHFEPISRAPLKTFDWLNHLLACSFCNSNQKRSKYPCDENGRRLLIDPTSEDPLEHMQLILRTGQYRELTHRGEVTISVFGLNRSDLVRGRYDAFMTRGAVLCYARTLLMQDREEEGHKRLAAMKDEPHASVLHAMTAILQAGGAETVLGHDVFTALNDSKIRDILGLN